ncbi:MAG: bifunctional rhamnulose-1-phosphate aldolase/short-chain dehydrogenase [Chloroflexi bacterium HGW-Chloroflexi-10]|nr:MAG: bifunctional rhamnulose-1-phosphate aldolase/short-chain dehydrogenase [Chloroflexi bacterium HGW-Chloroflexi-10]
MKPKDFQHVNYLWDDGVANQLDAVERLRYRSNLLGTDRRITNTGGGNTSSKIKMKDPLSGEEVDVLWVKGSGGDLRTSTRANFASLYIHKFLSLENIYNQAGIKGPKTDIEDAMVDMYRHTTFGLNPAACSIDTPLHGLLPFRHVDHMHPVSAIAIAASKDQERLTHEVFGGEVGWVPWQRPGFDLGLVMREKLKQNSGLKGLVMGQHGLINWADDDRACYETTLTLIEKAARYIEQHDKGEKTFGGQKYQSLDEKTRNEILIKLLPALRGKVSQVNRFIGTVHVTESVLQFVNSADAPRLAEIGTSCPDHFLRTKIKPLYVDWNPQHETYAELIEKLERGLVAYRADYTAYYEACKRPNSPAMRDPNPTVILIPGLGLIAWGKNKSESRVTAEFYSLAIEVMCASEAISEYQGLPRQEAFDIEYWLLEEAKLKRQPPEKEFARNAVLVIGAGSGIGKAAAHRIAKEGAHVICADLSEQTAQATARELIEMLGVGIGVAGTGLSGCGPAIGVGVDITNRESIQSMFENIIFAYGGIDNIIITAGIFVPPDKQGYIPDDKWALTFSINVTGPYLVTDEAKKIWQAQGLKSSLVITTSANAAVAKQGSFAYDTSKAAANHLVRELAIELSPLVRVNGLAPATVVEGSSMFPRDRVISSLTKYNIAFEESETTEALRDKLANFYAQRTLTKSPITLADQAEVAYLLSSNKFSKTTGQIISVDGGLHEAFLR